MGKKIIGTVLDAVIILGVATAAFILLSLAIHGRVSW